MRDATRLAHPPQVTPAPSVSPPLYQTSTFHLGLDGDDRFDYSRSGNPTREVLEQQIAQLERGTRCFAFTSGMAALAAVTRQVPAGSEIVAGADGYGGTYRLLTRILPRHHVRVSFVDLCDLDATRAAIGPHTALVLLETPTNPTLSVVDVAAVCRIAHAAGAKVAVDGSLASPLVFRPLALGADYAVHSATKVLCGHSDVTGGVVTVADPALEEPLYLTQNGEGTALAPFDAWLLLRGLKTLALRTARQDASAARVAGWLREHPAVRQVSWPGFPDHRGAAVHARQCASPGSVLSFRTGDPDFSLRFARATQLFSTTVSFGAVSSSVTLPYRTSHAAMGGEGPPADLVRLSVGIEDPDDLLDDLARALSA